jgi:hypothetical protein
VKIKKPPGMAVKETLGIEINPAFIELRIFVN